MLYGFDVQQVLEAHDINKRSAYQIPTNHRGIGITSTIFSPDYRFLAVGDTDGELSLWGVPSADAGS
jgi:hypothetical protein